MRRAPATAKLNLALVVGPRREDGNHEVATVLQRLDLADRIDVEPARALRVEGFREDTLVRRSLEALAEASRTAPRWAARIWKHIPVASGLGGGSSDAATALRLANETLTDPLSPERLHGLAAELGGDVPFFLTSGPQLGTGTGTELEPLELPQDYWVVLLLPDTEHKPSTASVYADFDRRDGAAGFEERVAYLREGLAHAKRPRDLARRGKGADGDGGRVLEPARAADAGRYAGTAGRGQHRRPRVPHPTVRPHRRLRRRLRPGGRERPRHRGSARRPGFRFWSGDGSGGCTWPPRWVSPSACGRCGGWGATSTMP